MFVRQLTADDWQIYKDLRLEALRLHPDVYGTPYAEAAARSDSEWRDALSQKDGRFFGLFDGDVMVGSGGLYMQDAQSRTGMLIGGYIRESYRGRKLSRLIYAARIDWAIKSGLFSRLVIGHKKGNEASRRANQAFGFEPIGEVEYVFGDGKAKINCQYEMRLA